MWREPPPYYAKLNKQSMNVNPVTNSLKRVYEQPENSSSSIFIKRPAILPANSRRNHSNNNNPEKLGNQFGVNELLARFFVNSGISYECVEDPSFVQFMSHFAPHFVLPTPNMMVDYVTRMAFPMKVKTQNFSKVVGPLTATLNTFKSGDEIFLAYSIHYFEDYVQRKNAVFMRKLILSEVDGESVLTYARRSINNFNYGNVRFTNMVSVDEEMAGELLSTNAVTNNYICFFTYLSRFIENVLKIPDFQYGLDSLRNFVQFLRKHADLYSKFRRLQLSKNGELDLPSLDEDGKWTSTTVFLTRCLLLHETFADFALRFRISSYISDDTFSKLSYLQRLMSHTRKFAKELSTPDSCVSQIVPTVVAIQGFLEGKSLGYDFEEDIKSVFKQHLQPLLCLNPANLRYLFATLLDPRYGYRKNIFPLEKWSKIESELMQMFSLEEIVVNDQNPRKAQVLDAVSKEVRKQKILEELKIYRNVISAARPNALTNIFHWWGARMLDLTNLYNKSREFLAPPAVAIDTELYFGNGGKWSHMCSKLSYEHLENALSVAGQRELFKGRGYISESALSPFVNPTSTRRTPALQKSIKLLKKPTPPLKFPEALMMQPPEHKKSEENLEIEPDLDVKLEVLEQENEELDQDAETEEVPNKCTICLRVEKPELLKEAILPNEKLLVLLGMVVGTKLSIDQARLCFWKPTRTPLICIRHYKEAADQIISTLQIRCPDAVFAMPQFRIQPLLDQIFEIRNSEMPLMAFKQLFIIFCEKYPPDSLKNNEIISFDAIFCAESSGNSGTSEIREKMSLLPKSLRTSAQRQPIIIGDKMIVMSQEPSSSTPILPKSQRAPRKQILDDDVAENDDMILRRLVPVKIAYESPPKIKNPGKCAYCGHTVERSTLIRVPKSEERRKSWFEKLGDGFERRCKAFENSFMCRAHFSETSFTKNGRLWKNAMPYRIGELKEYELVDEDFLNQSNDDDFEESEENEEEILKNEMLDRVIKTEELVEISMPTLDEIKQEPLDF
ncbi:unnamed protein product [Caenorhabditis angaria]|uniref:THAP-type domain-containing protein n=1 Tax=Caenorhabditis angaria TaxID=860376 RepID=A0A9P1ID71_9PELO|nr:unnamed protein product [Caenorhabditis angaria]